MVYRNRVDFFIFLFLVEPTAKRMINSITVRMSGLISELNEESSHYLRSAASGIHSIPWKALERKMMPSIVAY